MECSTPVGYEIIVSSNSTTDNEEKTQRLELMQVDAPSFTKSAKFV